MRETGTETETESVCDNNLPHAKNLPHEKTAKTCLNANNREKILCMEKIVITNGERLRETEKQRSKEREIRERWTERERLTD